MPALAEHRITIPIYRELGNRCLTVHGTGTLIHAVGIFWLVTALHVLRKQGPLWIPGKPFQLLTQQYHKLERLDLAYFELSAEQVAAIRDQEGSAAVSLDLIDASDHPLGDIECQVVGFPEVTINLDGASLQIESAQMVMTTDLVGAARLKEMRLDPRTQLAAKADLLRGPNGENLNKMSFDCLSGGAFWARIGGAAHLIGIVTDHDPKWKATVGTRTGPLVEHIVAAR